MLVHLKAAESAPGQWIINAQQIGGLYVRKDGSVDLYFGGSVRLQPEEAKQLLERLKVPDGFEPPSS